MPNPKDKREREGRCRLCGRGKHIRSLTRHHLIPKRRRGRFLGPMNHDHNIVPLCRPCHDEVELAIERKIDRIVLVYLRRSLTADEVAFIIDYMGIAFLNRMYPSRPERPRQEIVDFAKRHGDRLIRAGS